MTFEEGSPGQAKIKPSASRTWSRVVWHGRSWPISSAAYLANLLQPSWKATLSVVVAGSKSLPLSMVADDKAFAESAGRWEIVRKVPQHAVDPRSLDGVSRCVE
jgi:hypothetical protein